MKETLRFWGYGPDVFDELVGPGQPLCCPVNGSAKPVFGRVELTNELIERCGPLREQCAPGWWTWLMLEPSVPVEGEPAAWFCTPQGDRRPIVTRTTDNPFCVWFDLDGTLSFIQNEGYLTRTLPAYLKLGVNPARIPEGLRKAAFVAMHRVRALRRQQKAAFPQRPADPSVDCWRYIVRSLVEDKLDVEGTPLWPDGKRFAVTLNHDIDSDYCFKRRGVLQSFHDIEHNAGLRSAWMVVTKLLDAGRSALDELHAAGHEIGFHGSIHDHRLAFLPPEEMARRIECAVELIDAYGTAGIRSPAYLRTPALFRALDGILEYDMSMHDVIFGPLSLSKYHEGCSTCMPFFIEGMNLLEIPTTVPEDWTFDLQGTSLEQAWNVQVQTVERIKSRAGVANILTHPEPHHSVKPRWLELYRRLVAHVAEDDDAWFALPGEINRHWRSRQAAIDARWEPAQARRPAVPLGLGTS
ncbi:MAG: hypothetical protein JSU63_03750 [Phycisphaerales bacterium]|nr:MAG: hypothetical protein JSU63_03750 [Phycisphaerales bacterium]